LDDYEKGNPPTNQATKKLIEAGYQLLQKAAKEIGR
jgi:hypothetical protein